MTTTPTNITLYSQVCLNRNFPHYQLKQGDIARFIDTVPGPDGIEEGYVLEIFNALGESLNTVVVPKSAVSPINSTHLKSREIGEQRAFRPRRNIDGSTARRLD